MRILPFFVVAAAASFAGILVAQVKLGETAPDVAITGVVNHPAVTWTAIANQPRVLCFVKLAENDSLFFLETLDKLSCEFAFDPVHFLAVTKENKEDIEKMIAKENVATPIAFSDDATLKAFQCFKFPTVVVIDGAGKVRFTATPGSAGAISDAIVEATSISTLAPELPAAAKAIAKSFERWALGDAYKALDKELAKPKLADADKAKLADAKMRCSAIAARLAFCAAAFEKSEDWPRLVIALSRLEKECAGIPEANPAKAKLDALRAKAKDDAAFGAELSGALECVKGERFERDRDWKKAHSVYTAAAKNTETKSGKYAAGRAEVLKQRLK